MENPLSHFQFARFQFILKALDCINMPVYKGSTLRGGFGHAFKKVVCVKRERVCETCLLKGKCVYSYVFETPPPADTLKMRKYPFAPHPFIITPPLEEKRTYRQNEALCFELTLIGKSIDFLPYFIYTFDELGKIGIGKGKGKYQLEEVKAIHTGERSKVKGKGEENTGERSKVKGARELPIYSSKDKILHSNYEAIGIKDLLPLSPLPVTLNPSSSPIAPLPSSDLSPLTLHLSFLTPTRLKFNGNLSSTLEFHILIRNLLRRISLLSYFHCGEELTLDFKGLIEESKKVIFEKGNLHWQDWERYSNRQETKVKMGGFIGSVIFKGDFEKFLPFLLLGEYIHVGKGTSFGLGKYKILNFEP